jgi:diguanylate cyclase (GGDEF)-like protein/PAS domain S-box-containing protein
MRLIGAAGRRIRRRFRSAAAWRPGLREAVLAGSALVVFGLAVGVSWTAATNLRDSAVESAKRNADSIVRGYVDPILDVHALDIDASPETEVQNQLDRLAAGPDIRRINLWTRDGRVLYSTEASLAGRRLDIGKRVSDAFGGDTGAVFDGANTGEPAAGLPQHTLAIYVPIRGTTDGSPIGVFELYLDSLPVEARVGEAQQAVFLLALGAGAVLLGLLWGAFSGASRLLAGKNRRLTAMNARLNRLADDLHQREARFRSLVQNSSDVVVVVTTDGRMTYESDAVRRVLGHEPSSAGAPFDGRVHPDDVAAVRERFAEILGRPGAERAAEIRMRHADGSWRWVEIIGQNLVAEPTIGGVVLNYRDVTERKRLEDQLHHEAFHDPLTGLANRALFGDRVTHALARSARRSADQVAVLLLDLDDFKVVNDSLGHAAGDELLAAVAERVRACLRRQDTAARLGGDEFAILLEEATDNLAAELADRVLGALRQPFAVSSRQLFVQASIGIAVASGPSAGPPSAEHLLRNADAAMYAAKSHGKARYEFYEARMHASALERLELRERIEDALRAEEFVVHYQPVVDLVSGAVVGAEALVRWQRPDGRVAAPAEFIPLAEETGLIVQLGRHVLGEACRQAAGWRQQATAAPPTIAVNVSPRQLQEPGFAAEVGRVLHDTELPADMLVVEVTESALLDEGETTMTCIRDLKALGVRIALDDFGTGYSSLSHLRRFPIDQLKIDRSFVEEVDGHKEGQRALIQSIVRLARSLKLEIVAEGIERPEQLVRLRALGVHLGQGYHLGRAVEPGAFEALLRDEAAAAG